MAFHVQLRQFPHVARAFNLTDEELTARVIDPWVAAKPIQLQERWWDPRRARLTIYEGPELGPGEIGIGRGWGNVTRTGTEVTGRILEHGRREPASTLKEAIVEACPLVLGDVVALTADAGMRASERLAAAEQAVWELLHAGTLRLLRGGAELAPEAWESELLAFGAWRDEAVVLEAV